MPTDSDALFIDRAHHRKILVAPDDREYGSRVGGRPPAALAAAAPVCVRCGGPLLYVLTLGGDTLGPAVARGRALSLLTCRDYECRMQCHALVRPSAIVVLVHADTPRAAIPCVLDAETEGRALILGPALERARDSGMPALLNVMIDPNVFSSGTRNQTMYK